MEGAKAKKPLDELSKEELIQKCKGLLQIAQKAKAAKDDAVKELTEVKSKLENVPVLEETLSAITEQKLQQANEIQILKTNITTLTKESEKLRDELTKKVDHLETECHSKERQVKRLTDENESLLEQLDSFEAKVTRLQNQLDETTADVQVQKEAEKAKSKAQAELKAKDLVIKDLKQRLDDLQSKRSEDAEKSIEKSNENNDALVKLESENKNLKKRMDELRSKIKQIEALKNDNAHLKCALAEKEKMWEAKVKDHKDKSAKENEALKELMNENDKLKADLNKAESERNQALTKLQALEENLDEGREKDIQELQAKNEELELFVTKVSQEKCSLEQELKESEEKLGPTRMSLMEEIESLRTELNNAAIQHQNTVAKEDLEKQKNAVDELEKLLFEANEKLSTQQEVENKARSQLNEELEKFQVELEETKLKNVELTNKEENTRNRVQEMIDNEVKLKKVVSEYEEEVQALKTKLFETETELSNIAKDKEKIFAELEEKRQEIEALLSNQDSKDAVQTELESQIVEMSRTVNVLKTDLNEKTLKVEHLQKEIDERNGSLQNIAQENKINSERKQEEINSLKEKLEKENSSIDDLQRKLKEKDELIEKNLANDEEKAVHVEEMSKLRQEILSLNEKMREQSMKMQRYSDECTEKESALKIAQAEKEELEGKVSELNTLLEKKINELNELSNVTNSKVEKLQEHLEEKCKELSDTCDNLEEQKKIISKKDDTIKARENELYELQSKLEQSHTILSKLPAITEDFNLFRNECLATIEREKVTLDKFINDQEMAFVSIKQGIVQQLSMAEGRNVDIIDEMNEMNKELKKRGESISTLKNKVLELEEQLEAQQNSDIQEPKVQKNEKIDELQAEIETLRGELKKIRKGKENSPDRMEMEKNQDIAASETMSTSTLSKMEDSGRMADVESSFEERYGKLKAVAIKLKKKSMDQEKKIKELEENNKNLSSMKGSSQLLQNFQNLQQEYDKQEDVIEEQKAKLATLQKDLESTIAVSIEAKEKLDRVQTDLKNALERESALRKELTSAQAQLDENSKKITKQDSEIEKLLENASNLEKEKVTLTRRVDELGGFDKSRDLLDMELETAEKKIEELSKQNTDLQDKLVASEKSLEFERQLKENGEHVIKDLEHSVERESERAEDFKSKLTEARGQISNMEIQLSEMRGHSQSLETKVEELQKEKERLNCQLADLSGNAASNEKNLQSKKEALEKMVGLLQTDVSRKEKRISDLESKLLQVEKDFESYKVRAQNVLKSAKENEAKIERDKKITEVANLERLVESLNDKITDLNTQSAAQQLEYKHLQEDHDRLMERHSDLLKEMAAKELNARNKHEELMQKLNRVEKAKEEELAEAHRTQESIKQSSRLRLEDLQSGHSAEVAKLQKQIDDLENKIIRLQIEKSHSSNSDSRQINVRMLEREAAEGSENDNTDVGSRSGTLIRKSVSPVSVHSMARGTSDHTPVPLDRLLSSNSNREESVDRKSPSSIYGESVDQSYDLESRAISAEKRLAHVSLLLSESEAEAARLQQLTDVLKEEIRSYRRAEERTKHIENVEYLKNIVLKFVTLPGNTEKLSLIPVLTTILRLSPQEIEQIRKSVQVDMDAGAGQEVGWSSYLGLWSP